MKPVYRIPVIMAGLFVLALGYYYLSTDHTRELVLVGTVDANQVMVSAQVLGRVTRLAVEEGQDVKQGDLIALLDPEELAAAKASSDATALSLRSQLGASRATFASTSGDTTQTAASAKATLSAATAALAEAAANHKNQAFLTKRTVALAKEGIMSQQDRDTAVMALQAAEAHEQGAHEQMAAAEAAMKAADARTHQAQAAFETVNSTQGQWVSAQAQAVEAGARLGYTRILAPLTGKIGLWAARQGEVVNPGSTIVTIVDLTQTWVYAPIPETDADAVQLGDHLQVRMPGGALVDGRVLAKTAEGDFATQRDVSRRKRDIKTVKIKLLIENPGERYVPGMTAEVLVSVKKLVHP